MDKYTVACVQLRMRLPQTVADFREDLRRFMRAADAKRARLIVFPELGATTLSPALLQDAPTRLLRRAEAGKKRNAGLWQRMSGIASGWGAALLKADVRAGMAGLLDVSPGALRDAYVDVFSSLAREHGVTLVAPSAYLPDPRDGLIYNMAAVFGANGDLLGQQAKVMGSSEDEDIARRGQVWEVVGTEVGVIGLMLGSDVMFPEVGRLLAYQGAEVLVVQGACANTAFYHKLRAGILARMQDNQLFAVASFLVGENIMRRGQGAPFMGRSAIFAPQELTPRFNGVLVEMGGQQAEGVLSAEWDFAALKNLWQSSDTPVRRQLSPAELGQVVAALYTQLRALPQTSASQLISSDGAAGQSTALPEHSSAALVELVDLPVIASITSTWPLQAGDSAKTQTGELPQDWPQTDSRILMPPGSPQSPAVRRDDETDEMDSVAGGKGDPPAI